jgi:predicted dehydrogenase
MQQIDYDQGGYIIPVFPPVIDGVASTVHGVEPTKTGAPLNNYNWRRSDRVVPARRARRGPIRVGVIGAGARPGVSADLDPLITAGAAEAGPSATAGRRCDASSRRAAPATEVVATDDAVLSSDVDPISITTAPDTHAPLARLALEAASMVVEKPFAPVPDEGRALVEFARRQKLLLAAAPFVQLSPAFAMLHARRRRCGRHRALGPRDVREPRLDLGGVVPPVGVGPLGDLAIYNLKSLTGLLGPATEADASSRTPRSSGRSSGATRPMPT